MKLLKTIPILLIFFCLASQLAFAQPAEVVFEQYKEAVEQGNDGLYGSFATQASVQKGYHKLSAGQRKAVLSCIKDNSYAVENRTDNEAIITFSDSRNGKANPYIFTKENGEWKIDFVEMSKRIVFDKNDKWRWR
ncbi:MAG: hypothetical protein ABII88_07630 [Candidatus Omnitrophota bacterium]